MVLQLRNVTGSQVLDRVGEQIELNWAAGSGIAFFNDSSNCFANTLAVYDVADLVVSRNAADELVTNFEPLVETLLHQTGGPEAAPWDREFGGTIQTYDVGGVKALIVRQQPGVHVEIATLLASLRRQARPPL